MLLLSAQMQFPCDVFEDFLHDQFCVLPWRYRARFGPWRSVHRYALRFQHFLYAIEVVVIADGDACLHAVGAHDRRYALGRFVGIVALGLGDELAFGDAVCRQVVASDLSLAEFFFAARSAAGDDEWRQSLLEQLSGVFQPLNSLELDK